MSAPIFSQVQEVLNQLSEAKLAEAYIFLIDLKDRDTDDPSPQIEAMRLTLAERRRLMAQQAEAMAPYYFKTSTERQDWQAGDFSDAD